MVRLANDSLRRAIDHVSLSAPWPLSAVVVSVFLAAFVFVFALTSDHFVMSEARTYILRPIELDAARFFLFPELQWGHGRLATMASFRLTGEVCGVNHSCVNAVSAMLLAVAAVVAALHALQISNSLRISVAVVALWVMSPTVLGISMWQSTRFDTLAFIAVIITSAFWWAMLGRQRLSLLAIVTFTVVSVLLMAFAFNAKELAYYLVGVLPILAAIRGYPIGAMRRNLALVAIPLFYAGFFIVHALTHMDAGYAASSDSALIPENLVQLINEGLGLSRAFMGIWQPGPEIGQVHLAVTLGLLVVLVGGLIATLAALQRSGRRPNVGVLMGFGPELYLLATIGATMIIGARSSGVSVYYLPIPYWAALLLGALLLRRLSLALPAGKVVAWSLGLVFVASMLLSYAGLLGDRSAWQTLRAGSERMHDLGAVAREHLSDAPVTAVTWRTLERPDGHQYTLRGNGSTGVTGEIWPWLMRDIDARPEVTEISHGDIATLRADTSTYDDAGEVLLVIDADYRLQLLAQDGQVLIDRGAE